MRRLLLLLALAGCAPLAPKRPGVDAVFLRRFEAAWREGLDGLDCARAQAAFLRENDVRFELIDSSSTAGGHLAFFEDGTVYLVREALEEGSAEGPEALARATLTWAVHELTHAMARSERRARYGWAFETATVEEETAAYFQQLRCVRERGGATGLPLVDRVEARLLEWGPERYARSVTGAPPLLPDGEAAYLAWLQETLGRAGFELEEARRRALVEAVETAFGTGRRPDGGAAMGAVRGAGRASAVLEDPARLAALKTDLRARLERVREALKAPEWRELRRRWEGK